MAFKPFNPDAATRKYRNHLPHWRQDGSTYFVTMRLGDSVPAQVLTDWTKEREIWLKANGCESEADIENLTEETRRNYHRHFTAKFHKFLDAGYGACHLRDPANAEIVSGALRFFDGQRYALGEFVVMPNHVHLLATPAEGVELSDILHSWKLFTAREINKRVRREGSFWQAESFNHIVRSGTQLEKFQRYIAENPAKANLRAGEYLHWKPT